MVEMAGILTMACPAPFVVGLSSYGPALNGVRPGETHFCSDHS